MGRFEARPVIRLQKGGRTHNSVSARPGLSMICSAKRIAKFPRPKAAESGGKLWFFRKKDPSQSNPSPI